MRTQPQFRTCAPFDAALDEFTYLTRAGRRPEALAVLFDEVRPAQFAYLKALNAAVSIQDKGAADASAAAQQTVATMILVIAGSVVAALAVAFPIAIGMGICIIRSITRHQRSDRTGARRRGRRPHPNREVRSKTKPAR